MDRICWCRAIIVIKSNLLGFVVTMHSGTYGQYVHFPGLRSRDRDFRLPCHLSSDLEWKIGQNRFHTDLHQYTKLTQNTLIYITQVPLEIPRSRRCVPSMHQHIVSSHCLRKSGNLPGCAETVSGIKTHSHSMHSFHLPVVRDVQRDCQCPVETVLRETSNSTVLFHHKRYSPVM